MTQTPIAVKNGKARPKNPFEEYQTNVVGDNTWKRTKEWKDFESTVQWHDCPEATEDGEYEAFLIRQVYDVHEGSWSDVHEMDRSDYISKGYQVREIWRIVPQPQEPSDRVKKLHEMSVPMKQGDRFYRENEEAKTVEWKTAEDILVEMIDIMPFKLPIGSLAYIIEAMQAYSSQQNKALMEENKRFSEALEAIKKHQEIAIKGHPEFSSIWSIAKQALKPKQ